MNLLVELGIADGGHVLAIVLLSRNLWRAILFLFPASVRVEPEAGAAKRVVNADALVRTARELLEDPAALAEMREAGLRFTAAHRGATQRTLALIEPLLGETVDSGSRFARPE